MKNLNPYAGLNQIRRGYLCITRQMPLDNLRNGVLSVNELGYFLIFLISADWDRNQDRKGFIRYDLRKLSDIWKIPYQTLNDNLIKLIKKNVIIKERNTPKIPDFDRFTFSGANQIAKQTYTNEESKQYFDNLFSNSEIPLQPKRKSPIPFNTSSKSEFSIPSKSVVIKQPVRTNEEYQQIYDDEGYKFLTPDDMRWIDENVSGKEQVNNRLEEKDVVSIFFNGNWDLYQKNVVYGN